MCLQLAKPTVVRQLRDCKLRWRSNRPCCVRHMNSYNDVQGSEACKQKQTSSRATNLHSCLAHVASGLQLQPAANLATGLTRTRSKRRRSLSSWRCACCTSAHLALSLRCALQCLSFTSSALMNAKISEMFKTFHCALCAAHAPAPGRCMLGHDSARGHEHNCTCIAHCVGRKLCALLPIVMPCNTCSTLRTSKRCHKP